MCGIVGLHLRDPQLHPQLGRLLESMLCGVVERGPDSAGVAVYGDVRRCPEGHAAVSVLLPPGTTAAEVDVRLGLDKKEPNRPHKRAAAREYVKEEQKKTKMEEANVPEVAEVPVEMKNGPQTAVAA